MNKLHAFRKPKSEEGFTLIELMIVVVIIGILAAIAIPVFANQQTSAIEASAKSDLKNAVTAMTTESTKTGGKYGSTLPSSVTSSDGIKLSLSSTPTGPLSSNPALSVPNGNVWAWSEYETLFKYNTGTPAPVKMNYYATQYMKAYYFYPRTGGTFEQAKTVLATLCSPPAPYSAVGAYSCSRSEADLKAQWDVAYSTGKTFYLSGHNENSGYYVSIRNDAPPEHLIPINPTWESDGTAVPTHKIPAYPSLSATDPATYGSPSAGSAKTDSYCINATHETISTIKYHYDSATGKVKEGLCS